MNDVPRIAVINDMSGFGRCSLTVSIPILSAMGYQTCPMPTALLSAHTGYDGARMWDFTQNVNTYLSHWDEMGLIFAAVYTGYLGNAAQVELLTPFVRHQKDNGALCVVDPAMADHGSLYSSCTERLVCEMRRLVALADVTTPNLTEACLLTDTRYTDVVNADGIADVQHLQPLGERLLSIGCNAAVITGIHVSENTLENWIFENGKATQVVSTTRVGKNFAGTGDVFSSVLCGELLRGKTLDDATKATASYVREVTAYTAEKNGALQDGILFEKFLRQLCP